MKLSLVTATLVRGFALSLALSAMPGCPHTPALVGDAGPPYDPAAGSCVDACAALARVPCSDGTDARCVATCEHVKREPIVRFDVVACTSAKTVAEARACGASCP